MRAPRHAFQSKDVPKGVFCGAMPGKGQDVNQTWHKELTDAVVSIPAVRCGAPKHRPPAARQTHQPPRHSRLLSRPMTPLLPFQVRPGDMVFWHCDAVHAVEPRHQGKEDASVFFISACPRTPNNLRYIAGAFAGRARMPRQPGTAWQMGVLLTRHCLPTPYAAQAECFLAGRSPPDFPQNHDEVCFAVERFLFFFFKKNHTLLVHDQH